MSIHSDSIRGLVAASVIIGLGSLTAESLSRPQAPGPTAATPRFEVASIKPRADSSGPKGISDQPGGRFRIINMFVRDLIGVAYQLHDSRIAGGPAWITTSRFDIEARTDREIPDAPAGIAADTRLMLQALLADRFKLVVHDEERAIATYALVLSRADGKLGAKLLSFRGDCTALRELARNGPTPPPDGIPGCGRRLSNVRIVGRGVPIDELASSLESVVDRPVVDRTGLTGRYEYEVLYSRDQMSLDNTPPGAPTGPSIFTALQEQLGLKLEAQRVPIRVLVIDSVAPPTNN